MKTKALLIAAVSVTAVAISMLLVTSGIALAKGKPNRPPRDNLIPVAVTFENNEGDALQSDGQGSYVDSQTYIKDRESDDEIVFKSGSRKVYYNLSNCISENCPEPIEGFAYPVFAFYSNGTPFLEMTDGQEGDLVAMMWLYPNRKGDNYWVHNLGADEVRATIKAIDTDSNDEVDRWVITIPYEEVLEVNVNIRKVDIPDYDAHVPTTITIDRV